MRFPCQPKPEKLAADAAKSPRFSDVVVRAAKPSTRFLVRTVHRLIRGLIGVRFDARCEPADRFDGQGARCEQASLAAL
jgi:hypothetical protein